MPRLVALLLVASLCSPASGDLIFQIGNSLTWDTLPSQIDNSQWHVFCGKSLQYIHDNPTGHCVASSVPWTDALNNQSFDFVTVQPHGGTTLSQDVAVISEWMSLQPNATFVLHTAWTTAELLPTEWATTDVTKMVHSPHYYDALTAQLQALHPGQEVLRTAHAAVLNEIATEVESGDAPFDSLTELYRDVIHMNNELGRPLANALMRISLGQEPTYLPGDSPEAAYLNTKIAAVAAVPEAGAVLCWSLLVGGAAMRRPSRTPAVDRV